jgi:uncharacterized protein (TIGR04222 family)
VNPFDWRGPAFLVFYIVFTLLVFAVTVILRRVMEWTLGSEADPAKVVSDPYLIAYLRGQAPEAIRVATISLIDRDLLAANGTQMKTHDFVDCEHGRKPIEKKILEKYKTWKQSSELFTDLGLIHACDEYAKKLEHLGLMPNARIKAARNTLYAVMLVVLGGVSLTKIVIALGRGRSNVQFLVLLTIVACVMLKTFTTSPRT